MAGAPSTITVYGPDDKPIEVPAEQAAGLLRSGQYGLPEGAAVPVQKEDGTWETVSGAEAVQRAQSFKTRIGSAADVERTQKEAEFSGAGNKALAFGSGVVDSLGLGFGDAALVKGAELFGKGEQTRQFLQDADAYAPGSRLAGKGVGFVAPLLASGGTAAAGRGVAGTAARAATAPARALIAGTEAAGEAAARLAGGGNLGRFVRPVVQQGLEMGVYGAGQATSAAVVRDPQLDGEALAAAMGQGFLHGAGMGAGVGGAFGVGSLLVGRAGAAVERASGMARQRLGAFVDTTGARLRGALTDAQGRVDAAVAQAGGVAGRARELAAAELPGLAARGEDLLGAGIDKATSFAAGSTKRLAPEAATLGGKVDRFARTLVDVDKAATEKALQSLGADTKALREAAALSPEVKKLAAKQIVEELPALLNKRGQVLGHVEQAEAAVLLKKQAGAKIGDVLERLDGTGARVDVAAAADLARRQVVKPLRKIAGAEGYAEKVDGYLASLESKSVNGEMGFADFHKQRAFLDDLVYEAKASSSPARKALEEVRGVLEYRFTKAADEAAAGAGFAGEYQALKQNYQAARWIEETAKRAAERSGANRAWGMSEQTGAIAGAIVGGGGPTGIAVAAASAMGNRAIKQYGDQFTAAVLREMQGGKPLAEALADVTRRNVSEETKAFFKAAAPAAKELVRAGRERVGAALEAGKEMAGEVGRKALARGKAVAGEAKRVAGEAVDAGRTAVRKAGEATVAAGRAVGRGAARTARAAAFAADQRREFEKRRRELISFKAAGPARIEATAQRFLRSGASPEAAQVAAVTAARGAAHLARTLPPTPQRLKSLQPDLATDTPDPEAMAAWLRRARVVDNPRAALQSLGAGALDVAEVEALREVYPSIYQQVRDEVQVQLQEMTSQGQALPYGKALSLQTLFGGDVVADPTLDPEFIARWQAPPPPPAPGPIAPSRRPPPRFAHLYDPSSQEI